MEKTIKICEIFNSIQGEGRYAGCPMLFIRLSGCNRHCSFCDTKYSWTEGKDYKLDEIIQRIKRYKGISICWTGGEPLLQREAIKEIRNQTMGYYHHIETNGDLLIVNDFFIFSYLAVSPKIVRTAKKVQEIVKGFPLENWDIKVVSDLKTGKALIPYATMLMPLTTYSDKDLGIQQKVWDYCVKHNLRFTPRFQFWVWGKKRNV